MIKVFVVDDEKLVRRGIIGLIDWERFGMEIVGDSGSGEETVEFLKREEVDLLFSDLALITNARLASAFIYAICKVDRQDIAIKSWDEYK